MALAVAEALELGATAKNIAWGADILGTGDWLKDKGKQMVRYYRKRRRSYGGGRLRKRARYSRRAPTRRRRHVYIKRRRIGYRVGHGTSKRFLCANFQNVEETRTVYRIDLTAITKGDGIDQRERDMVNLRGFHVCLSYRNVTSEPVVINVAIVHDRREADGGAQPIAEEDFFRGSGTQRAIDFGEQLTGQQMNCLKMNSDRFIILKRKKLLVANVPPATPGGYYNGVSKNWKEYKMWMPLKRQLRYEDGNCQTPLALIWWMDGPFTPANTVAISGIETFAHVVTYFKEPKN